MVIFFNKGKHSMLYKKRHLIFVSILWFGLLVLTLIASFINHKEGWRFFPMLINGMFQLMIVVVILRQQFYSKVRMRYWFIISFFFSISYIFATVLPLIGNLSLSFFIRSLLINLAYCMFIFLGGWFVLTRKDWETRD